MLYRYVDKDDVMMVDVSDYFVKFYMDQELFTYKEFDVLDIMVIGSVLRNQFLTVINLKKKN